MLKKIVAFLQDVSLTEIWDFIISPPNQGTLLYIKVIFIIISLILLGAIVPLFLVASWLKYRYATDLTEFLSYRPFGAKKAYKQWNKIVKRLDTKREEEYKLAVIEADGLLEESLERAGYRGDTMEQRLGKIEPVILSDKDKILEAHKVRNNIVHNPDYQLDLHEAKKTTEVFEEALRSLETF